MYSVWRNIVTSLRAACAGILLVFWLLPTGAVLAQPAKPLKKNRDSVAVNIGDKTYRRTHNVAYAHNDGEAIRKFLIERKTQFGLFTRQFLTATAGAADKAPTGDADGHLTRDEIARNVREEVTYLARRQYRCLQKPKMPDGEALPRRLAVIAPPPKPTFGAYPEKRKPFEPEMVRIPGGSFEMGCVSGKSCYANEKPVHPVTISAFEIGKYEVTFDEWDACVAGGGCKGYEPSDEGWGRGKRSVINVSWLDVQSYVEWLQKVTGKLYRLPTEAEWEYVARAGSTTSYWWGNLITFNRANYNNNYRKTLAVDSFRPNAFGLYNVHGNVWEWVEDCWHDDYRNAPTDGSAWLIADGGNCEVRVLRGGSWFNGPESLRSANRTKNRIGAKRTTFMRWGADIGFRVSRTLNP